MANKQDEQEELAARYVLTRLAASGKVTLVARNNG
jgi:hypothetical protein